uniref:Peptidase_M13 domain-containing protein n=1 Tax=Macrostomum lignano TaxID=282301 RepID=A0A1I8JRG3_9PLAT
MNEAANPCEDFYGFACGSFRKRVAIPPGTQRVTSFSLQAEAHEILLPASLESPAPPAAHASPSLRSAFSAELYANAGPPVRLLHERLGPGGLRSRARDQHDRPAGSLGCPPSGRGPAFNASAWNLTKGIAEVVQFLLAHTRACRSSPLRRSAETWTARTPAGRHVLCFGQARTILGVREKLRWQRLGHQSGAALSEALLSVAQLFNFNLTQSNVTDLIDLEKQIAQKFDTAPATPLCRFRCRESERRDSTKIITSTVRYLMDNVNWLDFLARYASNVSYHITPDTPVNIRDENYLRQLCPLLQRFGGRSAKRSSAAIPRKLHHITDGVHGSPNRGLCASAPSAACSASGSASCTSISTSTTSRSWRLNSMIKRRAAWMAMDATTRRLAMAKLCGIRNLVGYPDYFGNETAMREEFGSFRFASGEYFNNLLKIQRLGHVKSIAKTGRTREGRVRNDAAQSINAYYSPSSNAQFPAAYISYGAIGAVIGHEVTHGFDDDGKNFDRNGNQRAVVEQPHRPVPSRKRPPASPSSTRTSWLTATPYKDRANLLPEPLLPNLNERFTKEQLLFIAYSQTWCELETKEVGAPVGEGGPAPAGKMRVCGGLSATTTTLVASLNAPAGARMNPTTPVY